MLFQIHPDTPRFHVFTILNQELLTFVERSIATDIFRRELFSEGVTGQTCWDNAKENNARAKNDLTKDKFKKFFIEIQKLGVERRTELYECLRDNQDLSTFFTNPAPDLLSDFPAALKKIFKSLASHLYVSTKDLQPIINSCGGNNISTHFRVFQRTNGNVCKACGMSVLSPVRLNISEDEQWRSDYDHQLCKSKYPLYAVHPDNLIPLCDICNQDAKKNKDLFKDNNGESRPSFYPYRESCKQFIGIKVDNLRDPEFSAEIEWLSDNNQTLKKLDTWNDVYEIKNLVLGKYSDLSTRILDAINPVDAVHMRTQIEERAREPNPQTYLREPWTFWEHKFFTKLSLLNNEELDAIWAMIYWKQQQVNNNNDAAQTFGI